MAQRIVPSLPRIKAPIGHIPQRLKLEPFTNPRGRLEVLRKLVTRLVREERFEVKYNKAEETRPYMERLLQMAIHRGEKDDYTNEMMNWWIMEKDLIEKIYKVLVPRYQNMPEPYTSLFRLPKQYVPTGKRFFSIRQIGVLELNGNPFPPLMALEESRRDAVEAFVRKSMNMPQQKKHDRAKDVDLINE